MNIDDANVDWSKILGTMDGADQDGDDEGEEQQGEEWRERRVQMIKWMEEEEQKRRRMMRKRARDEEEEEEDGFIVREEGEEGQDGTEAKGDDEEQEGEEMDTMQSPLFVLGQKIMMASTTAKDGESKFIELVAKTK